MSDVSAYGRWMDLKRQQEKLAEEILQTEIEIYSAHAEALSAKDKGTIHVSVPGYKLTVVKRENVKVDQGMAAAIDMGFRKKYELDAKQYASLDPDKRKLVDSALTITPGKPTFTVEQETV